MKKEMEFLYVSFDFSPWWGISSEYWPPRNKNEAPFIPGWALLRRYALTGEEHDEYNHEIGDGISLCFLRFFLLVGDLV